MPRVFSKAIYISTVLAHSLTLTHHNHSQTHTPHTYEIYRSTFRFPLVPSANVFRRASNSPPSPLLCRVVCICFGCQLKNHSLAFRSFVRSLCVFASIYITVLYCRRRCFPSFAVALFYTSFLLPRSMYVAMYSRSTHLQHSFSVNGNEMRARTERPLSCTRLVHIVCRIYIYVPYE